MIMIALITSIIVVILMAVKWQRTKRQNYTPVHPPSQSAILITGGSRGIGRKTADYLMKKGYIVFVTVRQQKQFDELEQDPSAPIPVLFDVTNDDHAQPAVERVKSVLKEKGGNIKLHGIVNNAGITGEGDKLDKYLRENITPPIEFSDPNIASRILETNVVGVARVSRAFLPLLRTEGGRIINIGSYFGSIAGQIGLINAYYEASKFALEGLSDSMRRTLTKKGIYVSLVKPGNIVTDMNRQYGEVSPEVVAKDIEHALSSPSPLPRYYPGTVKGHPVRVLCWIFETLPTCITDKL